MANIRGQHIDKTFLSIDTAEERGFIHRDYIAHCMRYSHVMKRLAERKSYATARLLDIGCGRELPLAKTLYSSRFIPEAYFGVDVGPITDEAMQVFEAKKFPLQVWEKTDILSITMEDLGEQPANHATMFEVAEHVEPKHLIQMLVHIKSLLTPSGTFFCSTPCWNLTDCADNHVNEMTYEAFGAMLEQCGWAIEKVYGTFASIRDYQHLLDADPGRGHVVRQIFDQLREYYDTNFLSCIFAPIFPAQSRNCLWECTPMKPEWYANKFPVMRDCKQPWGSSAKWLEMMR